MTTNCNLNIQSNSIRDDYKSDILDKTIDEINAVMGTVYGPYATDAYLTKDQQPYYTRDGKEVMASLRFDNPLSMYVLKILYQAVHHQGEKVGDGTTTLAILYTNIYKEFRKLGDKENLNISKLRNVYKSIVKDSVAEMDKYKSDFTEEDLKNLLYTCTQDEELSALFYDKLKSAVMDEAYIMVNKSNIESDLEVTVNTQPKLRVEKIFGFKPIPSNGLIKKSVVLYCNGTLDISKSELLYAMAHIGIKDTKYNFIILCNGVSDNTKRVLKDFITLMQDEPSVDNLSNILIFTLTDFRSFDSAMREDLVTYLYEENGVSGIVNALTFESMLYQSLVKPILPKEENVLSKAMSSLDIFDVDPAHIDKIRALLNTPFDSTYDSIEGITFDKPLGNRATARYKRLRSKILNEKSAVKKIELKKRLKTMYGQFINVEVGSKLLKDSQRKYELILDAVISSAEAVKYGVFRTCSLIVATIAVGDVVNKYDRMLKMMTKDSDAYKIFEYKMTVTATLFKALLHTVYQMGTYAPWPMDDFSRSVTEIVTNNTVEEYINKYQFDITSPALFIENEKFTGKQIVEPVKIMESMLEDSLLAVELATSKMFNLEGFMNNYI